ncbi:MAG: hypothetical protein ABUR63_02665 [Verrucomicrobiota bacterium]
MRFLVVVFLAMGVAVVPLRSAVAEKQDARKHYDRATSAFGLGRYAEAAVEYESAFRLRPDPALLYNCAQSYRLSGNKARALELYRNYLRLYGGAPNAEDARKHVTDLELEIAATRAVGGHPAVPAATAPPPPPPPLPPTPPPPPTLAAAPAPAPVPDTPPPAAAQPPVSSPPAVAYAPSPAPSPDVHVGVIATPDSAPAPQDEGEHRSLLSRPWFWGVVGAVVVAGTVGIILASSGARDPKAGLGIVAGN